MAETDSARFDFFKKGKSHEAKGEFALAIDEYAKALALADTYAHAWYHKGLAHYKLGQYVEAVTCEENALKLEPSWQDTAGRILHDARKKLGVK